MISNAAEYAIRAMLCLAARAPATRGGMTTHHIAETAGLPGAYLAKVMQALAQSRLVLSQRGVYGGFVLARPADAITLLDVVRAIEPSQRIVSCPLGNAAHTTGLCPLHRRLDAAAATVEQLLGATSLAQLVEESRQQTLFCPRPEDGPAPQHPGHQCNHQAPSRRPRGRAGPDRPKGSLQ